MFVRVRKQPGKDGPIPYAYLVKNQWNPFRHKHEQKILLALGRLVDLPIDGTLEKIITALDSFATKMGFSALSEGVVLSNLSGENLLSRALEYGSHLLSSYILNKLSILDSISSVLTQKPDKYIKREKVISALKILIAHRFYDDIAISELSTFNWQAQQLFTPEKKRLELADLYRSLDVLIEHKDRIEADYFETTNKTLFNGILDIVLFDTTSVYYYGWQQENRRYKETDLLQYGFSKDGKGDLKQLIVGVLMTREGVPIAHEVFPGNTADVVSFDKIIHTLKEKYHLGKIILIADRGMVSEANLRTIETEKLTYILGVRMRKLSPNLREKLLVGMEGNPRDISEMERAADNLYTYEYPLSKLTGEETKEILNTLEKNIKTSMQKKNQSFPKSELDRAHPLAPVFDREAYLKAIRERRYFVCLNPYVQKANQKKREYFRQIIQNKINTRSTKDWIVKNGYKKYIEFEDKVKLKLNEERLKEEELYDGKWVLITNDQALTPNLAGIYYKSLQFVERGFHDLKSLITIRPIYHFKEERIRAHIFVCFLALIVKWYIYKTLNTQTQEEGKRFIEEMLNIKAIAIDETIPLFVRTAVSPKTQIQMKKLGMKIPGRVILDGRLKPLKPNPKGGRPGKVDPNKFQLPLLKDSGKNK